MYIILLNVIIYHSNRGDEDCDFYREPLFEVMRDQDMERLP